MVPQGALALTAVILLLAIAFRRRPASWTHVAGAFFVAALLLEPIRVLAVWAVGHH